MRAAIITRHAITNYGSFLQAFATQEILESLNIESQIIDYIREDEDYHNIEKTILKQKPNWNSSKFKRIVYLFMRNPESWIAGRRFKNYRKEFLKLTRRYNSYQELKENPPSADCFITGSDQVWGPIGSDKYDDSYFLGFVRNGSPKFSYAASFGKAQENEEIENHFEELLRCYKRILVREDSAVRRVESMSLTAEQVLDPTLLLPRSYWINLIQKKANFKGNNNNKYILIYQLHNNPRLGEYAYHLAKEKKMKLFRVSTSLHQISRIGQFVFCPNPFAFLKLINNAECLITDSFHGTAFAINLNTQFIEILPENGTSSRNVSILRLTGLENRILGKDDDYGLFEKKIDYKLVNEIIERERKKSIRTLREMIETSQEVSNETKE